MILTHITPSTTQNISASLSKVIAKSIALLAACLLFSFPLQAAQVKATSFSTTTNVATTQVQVTGVGFTPAAVILWWNNRTDTTDAAGQGDYSFGYGFAISSSSRRAVGGFSQHNVATSVTNRGERDDACVITITSGDAIDGQLDLVSMDSDGATFIIDDAFSVSVRVQALFIGGVSAAIGTYEDPGATGNFDITTVGFQPKLLFQIGASITTNSLTGNLRVAFGATDGTNQFTIVREALDANGVEGSRTYGYNANCYADVAASAVAKRYSIVSFLSNGFRQNALETNADGDEQYYLALGGAGLNGTVGSVTTRTDGNDIAVSSLGYVPIGGLLVSNGVALSTSDTTETPVTAVWSMGAWNSTSSRVGVGFGGTTGSDPTAQGTAIEFDEVYVKVLGTGSLAALMDIKSVDSDGATYVMDDTEPSVGSFVGVVHFGNAQSVVPVLTQQYRRRRE